MVSGAHTPMNTVPRPILMTTNQNTLTLVQWLSPAYPVGAFAYSHGLEAAIAEGHVTTSETLHDWLFDVLHHGSGRNDCILLRAAHAADTRERLAHINATGLAFAAGQARQRETTLQGAAFCKTTATVWGGDAASYIYPVAVGAAAARLQIDPTLTCAIYLQAFASTLTSAAQRLMAFGQTDAQAMIAQLAPNFDTIAQDTKDSTLDDMQSSAYLSDICAMRHETLQPRIFRT